MAHLTDGNEAGQEIGPLGDGWLNDLAWLGGLEFEREKKRKKKRPARDMRWDDYDDE